MVQVVHKENRRLGEGDGDGIPLEAKKKAAELGRCYEASSRRDCFTRAWRTGPEGWPKISKQSTIADENRRSSPPLETKACGTGRQRAKRTKHDTRALRATRRTRVRSWEESDRRQSTRTNAPPRNPSAPMQREHPSLASLREAT